MKARAPAAAGAVGRRRRRLPALALAMCTALAVLPAAAQTLKLRLLETTDVHMHLVPYDYYQDRPTEEYGLALTATLIRQARVEQPNTLLFDNGDLLQGNPLADLLVRDRPLAPGQRHPAHAVLRALGYDAANLGNHEFNYGLPFLRQVIADAGLPYVNANLVAVAAGATATVGAAAGPGAGARADAAAGDSVGVGPAAEAGEGPPAFTPTLLLDRRFVDDAGTVQRLKIGVLGLLPPQVMQWDRQHLQGMVAARDIVQTAQRWVPRLRAAGADVVVVIAHSGFERGETVFFAENAVAKLAALPGVDAILFGHSHGEFPGRFFAGHPAVDLARGTIAGVPAVMAGRWGDHLGVVDLVLERDGDARWRVADARAALRPVYDRAERRARVAPDAEVMRLAAPAHEATLAHIRAEVARTDVPIASYFAQVADDASVQLVADAQLAYARRALAGTPLALLPLLSAAAPFKTGGRQGWRAYTDVPAGPLALRHVADLYVYSNTLKVVRLSGAQVREWLEMAAGAFRRIDPAGAAEQDLVEPSFPSFNFDTLDGLSYAFDVTQPARYDRAGKLVDAQARRVVDLRHQGREVRDDEVFAVVTNNYRASGGGNFPGLDGSQIVYDAPDENREALLQHLRRERTVAPVADGNWRVLPVAGVKLRFVAGAGGVAHLPRHAGTRLVRDNGDGSALYELAP